MAMGRRRQGAAAGVVRGEQRDSRAGPEPLRRVRGRNIVGDGRASPRPCPRAGGDSKRILIQAAMKRSVVLEKQVRRQPGPGSIRQASTWRTVRLAGARYRGGALPMSGARLTAALECANDAGGRCALWPSGDAHACYGVSHDTATSCAFAAGSVSAARAALTGTGATPQSEGLVRVRRQVCLRTPAPVPSGSLPANYPYAGRRFSAASRRRSTSSPAPCPSGYRTSPLRRPWCNRKAAIDIRNRWRAHRNGVSVHMHLDVDVHARYTTDPR